MSTQGDRPASIDAEPDTIRLVAEVATAEKRVVETGRTRIRTTVTEEDQEVAAMLARSDVTVERVPMDTVVTDVPRPRQEGDVFIIPVLEERLVIEKQLVLREEIRVRTTRREDHVSQTLRLKREHAEVDVLEPSKPSRTGEKP